MSNVFPIAFILFFLLFIIVSCASSDYIMYEEIKDSQKREMEKIKLYYDQYPNEYYIIIGKYTTTFSKGIPRKKIHRTIKKEIQKNHGHAGVIISDEQFSENWTTSQDQSAGFEKVRYIVYFIYFPDDKSPDLQ